MEDESVEIRMSQTYRNNQYEKFNNFNNLTHALPEENFNNSNSVSDKQQNFNIKNKDQQQQAEDKTKEEGQEYSEKVHPSILEWIRLIVSLLPIITTEKQIINLIKNDITSQSMLQGTASDIIEALSKETGYHGKWEPLLDQVIEPLKALQTATVVKMSGGSPTQTLLVAAALLGHFENSFNSLINLVQVIITNDERKSLLNPGEFLFLRDLAANSSIKDVKNKLQRITELLSTFRDDFTLEVRPEKVTNQRNQIRDVTIEKSHTTNKNLETLNPNNTFYHSFTGGKAELSSEVLNLMTLDQETVENYASNGNVATITDWSLFNKLLSESASVLTAKINPAAKPPSLYSVEQEKHKISSGIPTVYDETIKNVPTYARAGRQYVSDILHINDSNEIPEEVKVQLNQKIVSEEDKCKSKVSSSQIIPTCSSSLAATSSSSTDLETDLNLSSDSTNQEPSTQRSSKQPLIRKFPYSATDIGNSIEFPSNQFLNSGMTQINQEKQEFTRDLSDSKITQKRTTTISSSDELADVVSQRLQMRQSNEINSARPHTPIIYPSQTNFGAFRSLPQTRMFHIPGSLIDTTNISSAVPTYSKFYPQTSMTKHLPAPNLHTSIATTVCSSSFAKNQHGEAVYSLPSTPTTTDADSGIGVSSPQQTGIMGSSLKLLDYAKSSLSSLIQGQKKSIDTQKNKSSSQPLFSKRTGRFPTTRTLDRDCTITSMDSLAKTTVVSSNLEPLDREKSFKQTFMMNPTTNDFAKLQNLRSLALPPTRTKALTFQQLAGARNQSNGYRKKIYNCSDDSREQRNQQHLTIKQQLWRQQQAEFLMQQQAIQQHKYQQARIPSELPLTYLQATASNMRSSQHQPIHQENIRQAQYQQMKLSEYQDMQRAQLQQQTLYQQQLLYQQQALHQQQVKYPQHADFQNLTQEQSQELQKQQQYIQYVEYPNMYKKQHNFAQD